MKTDSTAETHHPPITDSVWIDPFVIQYQMGDELPCVITIDNADRHSRWFDSKLGPDAIVDPAIRDSHQLDFSPSVPPLEHEPLLAFAAECLVHYLEALPHADDVPKFSVQETYNVLKYEPGQAYHSVHADHGQGIAWGRHLTFVLFLNTISEGGELEFAQQSLRVAPVEGRAVIFPSGWTHAHRTLPASEDRYVFQLWWSFDGLA